MTPTLLLLALFVALVYLWSLSIKRQVLKHHERRTAQKATFKKPTTPSGGVAVH